MRTSLMSLIAGGLALAASEPAFAQGYGSQGYGYGGYGDHPMMWGNMFMGPVMMILMIVVVAVVVVLVLRFSGIGGGGGKEPRDNALAILNERFARGEIDKAEYEERRKALGN